MKKRFQFQVSSKTPPTAEVSKAGLYVRFQTNVKVHETVVRSEWPLVAIDLAEDGSVIGLECVPAPNAMSIGQIAEKAGLKLPRMQLGDLTVANRLALEPATPTCAAG